MTPYRKKMIEVALPLEAINKASAKEKSIRHGHPSTLHLWWARRPLAACRAVLFASLVDDPDSDPMFAGDEDIAASKRAELFNLIEELVLWENSNNSRVINRARAEIARCVATQKIEEGVFKKDDVLSLPSSACCRGTAGEGASKGKAKSITVPVFEIRQLLAKPEQVNAFLAEHAPPVLDPFCGGGSIPLEAQRLGLRAHASDLNPVPVLITKALIEIPPKFAGLPPVNPKWQKKSASEKAATLWQGAHGLAEDVRYYGKWMRDEAEKRIGHLYPKVKITKEIANDRPDLKDYIGQELTVIAWLWARNVRCPNPACASLSPLARSFVVYSKGTNKVGADPEVRNGHLCSTVRRSGTPRPGTVDRRGANCVNCRAPIDLEYIRQEGQAGRLGFTLLSIVTDGGRERLYLSPTPDHATIQLNIVPVWSPDTPLPDHGLGFRVQRYGLIRHSMLHTPRQLAVLSTLAILVQELRPVLQANIAKANCNPSYVEAIMTYLAFCVDKTAARNNALCLWEAGMGRLAHGFGMQTVSMKWDFAETNPFAGAGGDFFGTVGSLAEVLDALVEGTPGIVQQADAAELDGESNSIAISTDPPYYDNIGYADLSDLFYVWLRKSLSEVYPRTLDTVLTPKQNELIADEHRHGGKEPARHFFEDGLGKAFSGMRRCQREDVPMTVFYAFKQSESEEDDEDSGHSHQASTGWETMLEALRSAGYAVTGTWPMRTEQAKRMRDKGANALASSIVLVCRPRSLEAALATRKVFLTALRQELPAALRNLQHGSIAPVDLAQAAIGPGMAVFTRYSKVIETDGSPMPVRTALGIINQVLDEVLAEQEGEFDGDTRWALAWFEQFGVSEGPFGVAETLSKAKNTAVNGLVEAGVILAKAGKVRLVARSELPKDWDPATDKRLTVWEITQYLIRKLEQEGESAAAALVHKLGGMAETARDLAYRLYNICERKKWADEALAYNGLVIAWPELTKLALAERTKARETQKDLDF